MSQIWEGNVVHPVTVLRVPENKVVLVRTKDRDGYEAVQIAALKTKREFRGASGAKPGDTVDIALFKSGDRVRVSGIAKGRGFQGVVKRHGFGGGPKTHGQKNRLRAPGSIGSTAPQRVHPGRKMAGRMGGNRVTVKNLIIVKVDPETRELFVRGAVPGPRGSLLEVVTQS